MTLGGFCAQSQDEIFSADTAFTQTLNSFNIDYSRLFEEIKRIVCGISSCSQNGFTSTEYKIETEVFNEIIIGNIVPQVVDAIGYLICRILEKKNYKCSMSSYTKTTQYSLTIYIFWGRP